MRDNNTNNNKLIKKKKTDWEDEPDWTKKQKNTLKLIFVPFQSIYSVQHICMGNHALPWPAEKTSVHTF